MAKNKEEKIEPVVSSIPLPPSDSALVIDLPDGQKLLVGKIETGTVIEVATWRGTGRPDSRTNRLMLGMSNESDAKSQEAQKSAEAEDQNQRIVKPKFPKNVIPIVKIGISRIATLISKSAQKIQGLLKSRFSSKKKVTNPNPESITSSHLEIEEDFELDFQRILDEVNERRNSQKSTNSKSARKTQAPKTKSSPRASSKSKGKKSK